MATRRDRSLDAPWRALVLCCLFGLVVFCVLSGYIAAIPDKAQTRARGAPIDVAIRQSCQPASSRPPSEVCAQWIAAQAANESARWALGSLIVALSGVIGTLYYARKTARIAADATVDTEQALSIARRNAESVERQVEIAAAQSLRQLRAYVGIEAAMYTIAPHEHDNGASYGASIEFKNFGQTPAINFRSNTLINLLPYPIIDCPAVGDMEGLTKTLHPAMATSSSIGLAVSPAAWNSVKAGTHCFFLTVAIEYIDHAGKDRTEITRFITSADGPRRLALDVPTPLTFHSSDVDVPL